MAGTCPAGRAVTTNGLAMIGKTIANYKIKEEIGRGGMGVVYRALDTTLDRDVALKFLPSHLLENEQSKKRFHNEAKAASALDHPNICTIYEFGEFEGQSFIAMGLVEGESLENRLAKGPLTVKHAIELIKQVCRGLAAAHKKGIVHRDLKPANIMIDQNGIVKIMDFGLARREEHSQMTQSGSTLGTLSYMSPEQVRGETVDTRSDLWSLGVIFYEALLGKRPFIGEYDAAILFEILNETPNDMSLIKDISNPAYKLLEELLEKDRETRPDAADQLLERLNKIQPGEVTLTLEEIPEQRLSKSKETLTTRFIREMRRRRFIPIVGSYLAISIGLFEVGPYFIDQYKLDPRWHQVLLIWILSGFPLAGFIAYFHGRKGPDRVSKGEVLLHASIIMIACIFSLFSWQSAKTTTKQPIQTAGKTGPKTSSEEISELRKDVAAIRKEMLAQKTAADKAGAKTKATVYYEDAGTHEVVGNEKMIEGSKESLLAAIQAFTTAKDGYIKAKEESASVANVVRPSKSSLESRVVQMRADMLDVKTQVPGSLVDKNNNELYQQALANENKGENEYKSKDYNASLFSFEDAKRLYGEAKNDILKLLRGNADNARTSMNVAKTKIKTKDFNNPKYQKAIEFEANGNSAYTQNDFNTATGFFKDAELNFVQVATEVALIEKEKTDSARNQRLVIEQGVKSVIARFKRSLMQRDLKGIQALFTDLSEVEEKKWVNTFKRIKIRNANIAPENIQFGENSAKVDILMRLFYIDNKNRRRPPISYAYTWTIEQINGNWMISSFQAR